jgi:hypothetical protein
VCPKCARETTSRRRQAAGEVGWDSAAPARACPQSKR